MFRHGGIYLRPLEEKDLERVRKTRNDPSTWMYLTDIDLLDSQSQKDWFKTLSRQKKSKRFYAVCTGKERFVGLVRMDEFDWVNRSVRVGCDVVPSLRGKGYGSKIMKMIVRYGFSYLNMHRLWLLVLDFNSVARRVYEKTGFKIEGRHREAIYRDGEYQDYIIMSLLRGEWKE